MMLLYLWWNRVGEHVVNVIWTTSPIMRRFNGFPKVLATIDTEMTQYRN